MNKIESKSWNASGKKDTIANLAVLVTGFLIVVAGAVDLPSETAHQVVELAHQHLAMVR